MPASWAGALSVDPDAYEIWHSSQIEKGFNFISYRNPEVDRLLEEGRREYDIEKRKQIYWRIHELIAEDQPYTFLFVPLGISALQKKICPGGKGWSAGKEVF